MLMAIARQPALNWVLLLILVMRRGETSIPRVMEDWKRTARTEGERSTWVERSRGE